MTSLLYRPDMDRARDRLTTWWNGGDIGRPVMLLTAPRQEPAEDIPILPEPEGWTTRYSTRDFSYRVNLAARACVSTHYLGEAMPQVAPDLAMPQVAPDLGPNCLALYLGCQGVDGMDTVWFKPCIAAPEAARFAFDPQNEYWQFTIRLAQEQARIGKDKFLSSFPDLIEGLDTLAAMRDTQPLLIDLLERPEWVHEALGQITTSYFECYNLLYEMIADERGGSHFWAWAPGRTSKFQCDFSAMISPEMFAEFMVPVLQDMTARVDYSIYHWDGPGAIPHHDHLLSLPDLDVLQWTPGAGTLLTTNPRWWPLYHKTIEAGKKVMIGVGELDSLLALRQEFGRKLGQFLIQMRAETPEQAEDILQAVSI
jgi:5-methyltetrahydrofolate--homocysteine methyltransferase